MQYNFTSLCNNLLIAMPALNNNYFEKSVILICEHDETGAMGLVINKLTDITVNDIFKKLKIKVTNPFVDHLPVLAGGPVKSDKGFIIHADPDIEKNQWKHTIELAEDLAISYSEDILHAIANSDAKAPENFLLTLGFCEWEPGQLENEISKNDWLTMPANLDIIFNIPYENRWNECMFSLGINQIHNLSYYGGEA